MNFSSRIFTLSLFLCLALTARAQQATDKPIRALLVLGGCCHDYAAQKDILTKGISQRANVQWAIAYDPDTTTGHKNPVYDNPDWAKDFDVIVHDECSAQVKDLNVIEGILKPHKAGLPGVVLHCAMHSFRSEGWPKQVTPWFEFTGLATTTHAAQAPIQLSFTDKTHPVTQPLNDWTTINEELYNNISGKLLDTAQPLAKGSQLVKDKKTGKEEVKEYVIVWTNNYQGKARVFGTTLGHNNETVADARYLDLVTRGLLWATGKLDSTHLKPATKVLLNESENVASKAH